MQSLVRNWVNNPSCAPWTDRDRISANGAKMEGRALTMDDPSRCWAQHVCRVVSNPSDLGIGGLIACWGLTAD